ncbi:MAG: class I SAM-dependent methyltransferase [Spirochaetes bacterium]|nr:MAG: class I SAM-dependent methyltransferase [Spirochaetota bacterium]
MRAIESVPRAVKPRNEIYAGARYAAIVDPRAASLRDAVYRLIPRGARVIELACGTGDQLMRLAPRIREGVGVDISDRMIGYARRAATRRGLSNLRFELADAADLSPFPDKGFDVATASLFFHETPGDSALAALLEMKRMAPLLVIADFGSAPLPGRAWVNAVEFLAGFRHFINFRAYRRGGGMPALMERAGLVCGEAARVFGGTVTIWTCRADH